MGKLEQLTLELLKANNDRIFIQVSIIQKVICDKIIIGNLKYRQNGYILKDELKEICPGSFVIKF